MVAGRGAMSGARRRRWEALVGSLALVAMMTLGTASASATINWREHVGEQPYSGVNWMCGYPMQVEGVESHLIRERANKQTNDIVFETTNYAWQETWTNADGDSFSASGHGVLKDVARAKNLGGSNYQFKVQDAGQPIEIRDASGNLLARDRGRISFNWTFDFSNGAFEDLG